MEKFKMTVCLRNSREACYGGSDDEESEDFQRAAFVLTIIKRLFYQLPNEKNFITIGIIF